MGLFTWLLVGGLAGWIAGILMRGRGFGLFGNIVIGILGALLGGWLAGLVLNINNAVTGFNVETLLVAVVGASVLLFITRLFR